VGTKIKCDRCGVEINFKQWRGKTHQAKDAFDIVYSRDICPKCEKTLIKSFLLELAKFLNTPKLVDWQINGAQVSLNEKEK